MEASLVAMNAFQRENLSVRCIQINGLDLS